MYSSLRPKPMKLFDNTAMIVLVISIALISILDLLFNSLGMGKGALFSVVWITLLGGIGYSTLRLLKDFEFESTYFKILFFIFFSYGLITVFRGWSFNTAALTSFVRVPYIFWPFLIPLFTFFVKRLSAIGLLLKCFFYLGLFFFLVAITVPETLLSVKSNEILIYTLTIGSGFLLMNSIYVNKIKINISFLVIFIALASLVYLARRAGMFLIAGLLFSSFLLVILNRQKPIAFQILPVLLVIGLLLFLKYDEISQPVLENINKRFFQDTRSAVVDMFFLDMSDSMVFGKGMNATYFCPIGGGIQEDGIDYEVVYYRDAIENGYLQLMLSGGIVHIILFLMIAIPAVFNGIFQSKNQLTKACGIMISLWLIFMIGSGQPSLSFGYILVWICIGICYKKSIRNKSNEEIREGIRNTNIYRNIPQDDKRNPSMTKHKTT